jgi:hypothetical protein
MLKFDYTGFHIYNNNNNNNAAAADDTIIG